MSRNTCLHTRQSSLNQELWKKQRWPLYVNSGPAQQEDIIISTYQRMTLFHLFCTSLHVYRSGRKAQPAWLQLYTLAWAPLFPTLIRELTITYRTSLSVYTNCLGRAEEWMKLLVGPWCPSQERNGSQMWEGCIQLAVGNWFLHRGWMKCL